MVVLLMAHDVRLTWSELRYGGHVGMDRYVRQLSQRRALEYGESHNGWFNHVVGAWGELVVAKVTGIYWCGDLGCPDRGEPDVGPYHVRTAHESHYRMILWEKDPPDAPYVFVVPLQLPMFRIAGWCYGHQGMLPEFWQSVTDRPPSYFVPQHVLRPLAELVDA